MYAKALGRTGCASAQSPLQRRALKLVKGRDPSGSALFLIGLREKLKLRQRQGGGAMGEETRLIYVTAPSRDEALRLARLLVEERLVACANVLGPITSVYWWDGKLNESSEVALLLKTRATLVEAVTARIRRIHPYDCPCVVSLAVDGGNPAFLEWIVAETVTD